MKILPILGCALGAALTVATAAANEQELSPMEKLGESLFFDTNLSTPPGQSCAACHAPGTGFTGPDSDVNAGGAVYEGAVRNRFGDRKPPNVAYGDAPVLDFDEERGVWFGGSFWDGRATGWVLGRACKRIEILCCLSTPAGSNRISLTSLRVG
jgi:cytochrome c peroxidase